jgi:hypothetical protein
MRRQLHFVAFIALSASIVGGGLARAANTSLPKVEVMELTLHNALFQESAPTGRDQELILELERIDGQWQTVIGVARDFNCSVHLGNVEQATIDEKKAELHIAMQIVADSWVPGGPANFTVKLQRTGHGGLEGTYQGKFRGKVISDRAEGTFFTREYLMGDDFVPVRPGEHPRTVFRKSELPKLREKLKTRFGRAVFAKMSGPVGWGVQYQLTGDKKYADMARKEVGEIIYHGKGCSAAFAPARALGVQVERVAVAYDLCYDAWPEDFKMDVVVWLQKIATRVISDPRKISLSANWSVCSNHVGSLYAGVAFSGLVLWGEKSPAPPKPTPITADLDVPPAEDFRPAAGVPVVPLEPGVAPKRWLATEAIKEVVSNDPKVSMQGVELLRPKPGTKLRLEEFELTFRPLKSELVMSESGISLKPYMNNSDTGTFCVYTVLEVKKAGLYKLRCPATNSGRTQLALNGRRLEHDQVVRLEKGHYPMIVLVRLLTVWESLQPWFEEASQKDLAVSQAVVAEQQARYAGWLNTWQTDMARWEDTGGANPQFEKLYRLGRRMMYLLYREAVGTGGFQAEISHYNKDTTDGPNRYAAAHRRCFGYDVSPFDDITYYLPRHVFSYIYPDDGRPWAQDINGSVKIGDDYFAALFPISPDEWKPALLWAWNRMSGVIDEASKPNAAQRDPAWSFVYYPLDMQPKPPATCMPLTWEASGSGFYGFRNRWKGGEDIVTQVFLKRRLISGWNGPNAGTFRIAGLGKTWAVGPTGRERRRWNESVVWMPEDDHFESARGRLAYLNMEEDGSGVIAIDYTDVYSKRGKSKPYSLYGGFRRDGALESSGITGLRSFGVDYGRKSGADALFVVVDKIAGGHRKVWLWQVPKTVGDDKQEKMIDVDVKGNTFTIPQGKASLHATFAAPSPVKLMAGTSSMEITISGGHKAGQKKTTTFDAVFAEGGNDFFFVATLQQGDPPPVKVIGKGLSAKVYVGKQLIQFDGEKVVFGR